MFAPLRNAKFLQRCKDAALAEGIGAEVANKRCFPASSRWRG
jgi:hypothetical protein